MGVVPVPPSDNQIEYINAILKKSIDETQIHKGGNSTLINIITENHVLLLMTYYSINENNEIDVANCVFDSNMIIPFMNINEKDYQFKVYCDKIFPFPLKMFPEANVTVSDNIFYGKERVIAIETPNDRNILNPQPNINESLNYMRRVMKIILDGLRNQQKIFETFAENEKNENYKELFGIAHDRLDIFNEALRIFFSPHSNINMEDMQELMKSDNQKVSNLLSKLSPDKISILQKIYKDNQLNKMHKNKQFT
jgi:hypothetical protein